MASINHVLTREPSLKLVAYLATHGEAGRRELSEQIDKNPRRDWAFDGLLNKLLRDAIITGWRGDAGATRFALTTLGHSLAPHAVAMVEWLSEHTPDVLAARAHRRATLASAEQIKG